MRKLSPKRRALLQLISDAPYEWVYFPAFTSIELEKYGLTFWDKAVITWAEKAGMIETKKYGHFGKITEAGMKALREL